MPIGEHVNPIRKGAIFPSRFKSFTEVATVSLAVLAIIFAAVQFADSQDLKKKLKYLLDETSTKYIGSFPDNLDYINDTLVRAREELLVLVDFPGYGHYSKPRKYQDYVDKILQLRQAAPSRRVRMLFYSAAEQKKKVLEQFDRENWNQIRDSSAFKEFFGTFHPDRDPPATYDELIDRLLSLQQEYEKRLCNNGVEIEHIDHPSGIFFWLEDEDSAVFAINNRAGKDRELSFHTSDGKLVRSFQSMFERFWLDNKADPQRCPQRQVGALRP